MKRVQILIASVVLVTAGCAQTVSGNPQPLGQGGGPSSQLNFPKLNHECELLSEEKIGEIVKGRFTRPSFIGAICRWNGSGSTGNTQVTLNWFETGSLKVERETALKLNYQVTDIAVQGLKAIRQQRPNDPDSCGVSVGSPEAGVIGWWVQYLPGTGHTDPCDAAKKLADASLNLSQ